MDALKLEMGARVVESFATAQRHLRVTLSP